MQNIIVCRFNRSDVTAWKQAVKTAGGYYESHVRGWIIPASRLDRAMLCEMRVWMKNRIFSYGGG